MTVMLSDLIDSVHLRLTRELEKSRGLELSLRYSTKWRTRIDRLDMKNTPAPDFFRQVLQVTQETSLECSIDQRVQRDLRKIILDEFLVGKGGEPGSAAEHAAPPPEPADQEAADGKSWPHTSRHHVFLALLETLCRLFDAAVKQPADGLRQVLAARISTLDIPPRSRRVLHDWAASRDFTGDFGRVPVDQMRTAMDMVYTVLCDEFGPTRADSIITEAADLVGGMKEARDCPPAELL